MSALASNWYFVLMAPIAYFLHRAWKAKYPRDRYRWYALQNLSLGVYSVGVFLRVGSSGSPAWWLAALPMLAMAFITGAVTGVYVLRWLATPPGPARPPILACPLCNAIVHDDEAAYHHIRLLHPDWHEELTAQAERRVQGD